MKRSKNENRHYQISMCCSKAIISFGHPYQNNSTTQRAAVSHQRRDEPVHGRASRRTRPSGKATVRRLLFPGYQAQLGAQAASRRCWSRGSLRSQKQCYKHSLKKRMARGYSDQSQEFWYAYLMDQPKLKEGL